MNFPYFPGQEASASSQEDSPSKQLKGPKEAIKDLLRKASSNRLAGACPRCGRQMTYIETTLWFYEDNDAFHLRVPACQCARPAGAPNLMRRD